MNNILAFVKTHKTVQKKTVQKGHILCKRGFHRWELLKDQQFDTKQGKLLTAYQCTRCGMTKNEAR